jgi:hypothetical protein
MTRSWRSSSVFCALLMAAVGCGPGVREDRSLTFSGDAGLTGFQHGQEGVFVADTAGGRPHRIFQPGPEVVAVSSPLWAPNDRRLIFTTADRVDRPAVAAREPDPAGDLFTEGPTSYTCWLRPQPRGGADPKPAPLFDAVCGHPAYVAANLAVRWSPDGSQVFHVRATRAGRHGLFAFDIKTRSVRQLLPHEAPGLAFEWAPGCKHLACALAGRDENSADSALLLGVPGHGDWWAVPGSDQPVGEDAAAPLARARALLPSWTPDGSRAAVCVRRPAGPNCSEGSQVIVAWPADRHVEVAAQGRMPFRDLHWRPDGARLGAIGADSRLVVIDPRAQTVTAVGPREVDGFAGWDASGTRMGFVAFEPVGGAGRTWAFVLVPDARARMAVFVRAENAAGPPRRLVGGIQMSFPRWAPAGRTLSLWATFRPAWRSWPSILQEMLTSPEDPVRGLRLQPGDPALVIDTATGELDWKTTSSREEMQVGHNHLLARHYAAAWRWYQRAQETAAGEKAAETDDPAFFHYYCLKKLGRNDEAARALTRFNNTFLARYRAARAPRPQASLVGPAFGAAAAEPSEELLRHWQDLYAAEVFLSLDAAADGEAFFREALAAAHSDPDRLSKAVVLTQFLLLAGRYAEYADLATDTVLPLLLRTWTPRPPGAGPLNVPNALLAYGDGLSLVPLFAKEFVAGLKARQVRGLLDCWQAARSDADDDVKRLAVDLFLAVANDRLGLEAAARRANECVAANPVAVDLLGPEGITGLLKSLRNAPQTLEGLRKLVWLR